MVASVSRFFVNIVQDHEGKWCKYRSSGVVLTVIALAVAILGTVTYCTQRLLRARYSIAMMLGGGGVALIAGCLLVANRSSQKISKESVSLSDLERPRISLTPRPSEISDKVLFERLGTDLPLDELEKRSGILLGPHYCAGYRNDALAEEPFNNDLAVVLGGCETEPEKKYQYCRYVKIPIFAETETPLHEKMATVDLLHTRLFWQEGATLKDALRALYRFSASWGCHPLGYLVGRFKEGSFYYGVPKAESDINKKVDDIGISLDEELSFY